MLDGSRLEIDGVPELELTGYFFRVDVLGIQSPNVHLFRDVDPAHAAAVEGAAVFETDLGHGVGIWRADRTGQPIYMTVDFGGWVALLHVGNETPPESELLLSVAEDLRGEVTENGVVLPDDVVDDFTIYLGGRGAKNQVHLGAGQCYREVVPGSEVVEHPPRGEMVRGSGYASWCDPATDIEVRVHGDDDFVDRSVQVLRLSRSGQ